MQKGLAVAGFVLGLIATLVSAALTVLQIIGMKKSR